MMLETCDANSSPLPQVPPAATRGAVSDGPPPPQLAPSLVAAAASGMAMVNQGTAKDSRWLQLEVCREFQRNKCSRPDTECKFAHPPANVEVQNGRVIACYDSIKGRCNREKPPCKYFHPPQHLKDQLLINGRNHLALKNALLQQLPLQPVLTAAPGLSCPLLYNESWPCFLFTSDQHIKNANAANPYLPALTSSFAPFLGPSPVVIPADNLATPLGVLPTPLVAAQKVPRTDRLEVCREFQRGNCKRVETECRFAHPPEHVDTAEGGTVTVCMDNVKGRCSRELCRYFHPPPHLQAQLKAAQSRAAAAAATATAVEACFQMPAGAEQAGLYGGLFQAYPSVVPYSKRPAVDKSGVPVYQPSPAYQHALAVQPPFVPVSFGGHPTSVPRF